MKPNLLIGAACAVLLSACQTSREPLTTRQQAIACDLKAINPQRDPLAAATPIIDIHTHTFNGRYLPLKGILLGKRDAFPPFTSVITDRCAQIIAEAFVDRTELAAIGRQKGIAREPDTSKIRAKGSPGLICKIFLKLIDKAIREGAWDERMPFMQRLEVVDGIASRMTLTERLAVRSAASMMGMDDHIGPDEELEGTVTGIQAATRFFWLITQNDAKMTRWYRKMHAGVSMKGPITMVSHMMDLGPVYDQKPDGKALLDFHKQQVRRMEDLQRQEKSGLIYFVAYCPYRDEPGTDRSMSALDLVRDAVMNHGAKGVKVYPPSGYRAAGNDSPDRPFSLFTQFPGKQWDARYKRFSPEKAQGLDTELNELLEWCIERDVPVFVHAGHGEFEARKGYGMWNSNPLYWEKFLESHSSPGKPCKLRLCLGHAGGGDYWFGEGKFKDWGERVYKLCTSYPNVYCEITTGDEIIDPESQAYFVDQIASKFEESKAHCRYPFSSKLMFGTDWYLPDKGKPQAVMEHAQQAFLHPRLRKHYSDYFSGNARRYLKTNKR